MCFFVFLLLLNIPLHNLHARVSLLLSVIFKCMAGPGPGSADRVQTAVVPSALYDGL